jgi:hypothetical protein
MKKKDIPEGRVRMMAEIKGKAKRRTISVAAYNTLRWTMLERKITSKQAFRFIIGRAIKENKPNYLSNKFIAGCISELKKKF